MSTSNLYERLGGRPVIEKVHKLFYDKVYEHPWLKGYFDEIDQKHIEAQQSDFMGQAFGGPRVYRGKAANTAHKHIFIDREIFDLRHALLRESIEEAGVAPELMAEWLRLDAGFERAIVKQSEGECEKRYANEDVVVIPKPPANHRLGKS
ncbi:MAG: group 1 truncated hemoglobin [Myxococcota bacterium]|nr:group 1 truncated hemoglobin [Myxococcota bacterium]